MNAKNNFIPATIYNIHERCCAGHLMEWFYSGLAGIRQDESAVAFKKISIIPEPVGDISSARAGYGSPYGPVSSEWNKQAGSFELKVEIPANTTATIYLPANRSSIITENGQRVNGGIGARPIKFDKKKAIIHVGSGIYQFMVQSK